MTLRELSQGGIAFRPALLLEAVFSRRLRWAAEGIFTAGLLIFGLAAAAGATLHILDERSLFLAGVLEAIPSHLFSVVNGIFLLALAGKLLVVALDAFFYSHYFLGMETMLLETGFTGTKIPVSFECAAVLFETANRDVTDDFMRSRYGGAALARSGLEAPTITEFLARRTKPISADSFCFEVRAGTFDLTDYAAALLEADQELANFLALNSVEPKDFIGAVGWVVTLERLTMRRRRFWSKDALGRIPGIGKDWAYGGSYILEKYSREFSLPRAFGATGVIAGYGRKEAAAIETVLARHAEANALLVGDYTSGMFGILEILYRRIAEGKVLPPLEHKRLILFEAENLIAAKKTKSEFEAELIRVLKDAVHAGDVILVFADFPAFIKSAAVLGVDIVELLDGYLVSPQFQVIALSDSARFNAELLPSTRLMQRFEKITVASTGETDTIAMLEEAIMEYEAKQRILFTYPAVRAIALSAERYFTEGLTPDKAIDLLSELVPKARVRGRRVITKTDVLQLVEQKTGIPSSGGVTAEERDRLLNLEQLLHTRIIGQDRAVAAIANAMRRARAGIGRTDRPLGSFLFLGPTGVGKTETVKALAAAFFGDEKEIIRFDMSEYNTPDAVERLIGSFSYGKAGVLSSRLREKPYGVVLLDEFEKTTKEVMDIFLQVLDEGFFSDMSGKRVNCRNVIIVATSNAASDMIFKMVADGRSLDQNHEKIVEEIIARGIFKPELLNRFDGVIVFHPLAAEHLGGVAKLLIGRLRERLAAKNIELVVNDDLINFLVRQGADSKFGGRAMNRLIQDELEEYIARRILSGEVKPGSRLLFNLAELAKLE